MNEMSLKDYVKGRCDVIIDLIGSGHLNLAAAKLLVLSDSVEMAGKGEVPIAYRTTDVPELVDVVLRLMGTESHEKIVGSVMKLSYGNADPSLVDKIVRMKREAIP